MVQWYFNYITHRDIEIEMHGEKKVFTTGLGFPQGGVCSAKFWLIAFDYAIQIINRYNIEGNGYADDCSALAGGRRLDHALKRLQKMLDDLTEWGRSCGLKFNPEKSIAVVFSRRRKGPPFALKIDGKEIQYQTEVKYLGVTLDSKLHWTKHIEDKLSKTKKYLGKIATMTRNNWGPKPKLMRWAYIGIVRPMMCYGSMIWGHRAPELLEKFRRINRMAINTFANFPRSTPTCALEIMLDIKPLHLFCVQEAVAARVRLDPVLEFGWNGEAHTKRHKYSHMRFLEDKLKRYKINPRGTDSCHLLKWNSGFKINRESFNGAAKHRQLSQYNAFTDGSRQEEKTGAGLVLYKGQQEINCNRYSLPDYATVFQAEVLAVREAAKTLSNMNDPGMNFVKIFVDSQAAISAIGNPLVTSRVVAQAVEALNVLAGRVRAVTLVWIPAHKGHIGNERADVLAKEGAAQAEGSSKIKIGRPAATVKSKIKENISREWQEEWTSHDIARHTKSFYLGPNPGKAKFVYKLARLELGRFVRIVTGHNNLNFFQNKIGLHASKECRFCGEYDETFTHLSTVCPRFFTLQREVFRGGGPTPDMKWSVRGLLEFSYAPGINEAYEGSWVSGDPIPTLNETLDLDLLANDWGDDNNNTSPDTE